MANQSITKTITQPEAVITQFANDLGYQEQVANPDYVPAEYDTETMEETTPAVGEPTIANTDTRLQFVKDKFDDFVSKEFFGQFAKRNVERAKMAEAKELTEATIAAIKSTITTKVE
tara:strand:- start:93 stop:443 length:351 start_codon:yes stop_codon:yes gene_type:complete